MKVLLESIFKKIGVTAEPYTLVNNYGYTIKTEKLTLDVQHTLNVYGVAVDYWTLRVYKTITTPNQPYEQVASHAIDLNMNQSELIDMFKKYL